MFLIGSGGAARVQLSGVYPVLASYFYKIVANQTEEMNSRNRRHGRGLCSCTILQIGGHATINNTFNLADMATELITKLEGKNAEEKTLKRKRKRKRKIPRRKSSRP